MAFDRQTLAQRVAELASNGVYLGTSSWKYEGWRGQLYDDARYVYRGRFARTRFERMCLAEYAKVFRTVCVDAAYYAFPRREYLEGLAEEGATIVFLPQKPWRAGHENPLVTAMARTDLQETIHLLAANTPSDLIPVGTKLQMRFALEENIEP